MTIEFDMTILQGSSCNHFWHWLPPRAAAAPGLRQFEASHRLPATPWLALCLGVSSPSKIGRDRTLRLRQHLRLYQRLVLHSPELADNPGRGAISGMAASQVYRNYAAPASAAAAGCLAAAAVAAAKSAMVAAGCLAAAAVTAAKSAMVAAGCLAAAAVAAAKSAVAAAGCLAAAAVTAAKSAAADAAVAFAADATRAVEASARSQD
jgi:hypothetical protein